MENEDIKQEFRGSIRLRNVGGYLSIPKGVLTDLGIKQGDVVEVSFVGCPTNDGTYTITNTLQSQSSVYLRKLDLRMIGLVNEKWIIVGSTKPRAYIKVVHTSIR